MKPELPDPPPEPNDDEPEASRPVPPPRTSSDARAEDDAGTQPSPTVPPEPGPRAFTPEEAQAWFDRQPRAMTPEEAEAWFAQSSPRPFTPQEAQAFFSELAGSPSRSEGEQAPPDSPAGPPPSLPGLDLLRRFQAALRRSSSPTVAGAPPTQASSTSAPPPASPPASPPSEYARELQDALRRAPWMLLSVALHALLMAILANMVWLKQPIPPERNLHSEALIDPVDLIPEAPEEPPVELEELPIEEPDFEVVEEDPVEAPEASEMEEALDAPFDTAGIEPILGLKSGTGGFRGKYRNRGRGGNGRSGTQRAVAAGLDWLARHQRDDGSWDADGFHECCAGGRCSGPGGATNDVGVSALALLAFLGSGNTARDGAYREQVRQGLRWLRKVQDARSGCFGSRTGHHFLYGHALATLALCEAYHLSEEPILREPAQRGLYFIARSRNPYAAWRYHSPPNGDNDSSVTGWMLFALFAGKDAGLTVDEKAIRHGMDYLDKMTHPATFRTGYHSPGQSPLSPGEAMTAVALLLRVFHGESLRQSVALKQGAELVVDCLPSWEQRDYYYWYYASYAMWQLAGTYWSRWQGAMLEAIVDNQIGGRGCQRGSWEPEGDRWGGQGGRVYSTAMCTLSLQVYYRYDRVFGAR